MKEDSEKEPFLLYDGVCGFCNKTVQTILSYDKRGTMRFAALQSDYGKAVIERHPISKGIDSVVFLETSPATGEERVFIRSNAALHVVAYLGGVWKLLLIAYIIPTPIRDFFYDLFARYHHRIFGRYDSSRLTMTRSGFELMTVYPDRTPAQFKHVSISSLISTQRQILRRVLGEVLDKLRREEMEHREQFKHEKLVEVFPPTMAYYFEKLYESGFGSKPVEFGGIHVRLIQEIIEQFRTKLEERGSAGVYDSVDHELKLLSYPLEELSQYFSSRDNSKLNERDVFIFINFVEDRMDRLKQMARGNRRRI